jgi:hypothetical protein
MTWNIRKAKNDWVDFRINNNGSIFLVCRYVLSGTSINDGNSNIQDNYKVGFLAFGVFL